MIELINGKVPLSELARSLGVTSSALRQHLRNRSPLGENAEKFGHRATGDYILDYDSVWAFLEWISQHGRKIKGEAIERTREELKKIN